MNAQKTTTRGRALALFLAFAVAIAMAIAPGAQAHADLTLSTSALALSEQESYSTCAVLMSDGIVYPADQYGNKIDETWEGNTYTKAKNNIDGSVTKLFIASDIQTLPRLVKYKYVTSSGKVTTETAGHSLNWLASKIQKVQFLLNSNGKSSVTRIECTTGLGETNVFENLKLLDEVINLDKTQITAVTCEMFRNCSSLCSISLPNTVTSIDKYAFADCIMLNELDFGDSLMSVGDYAFKGCTTIGVLGRAVIFPRSFVEMGGYAFKGCQNLHTVIFLNTEKCIVLNNQYVFDGTDLQKVYVTNRLLGNYNSGSSTKNWSKHLDKIRGFLEVASVPNATYTGKAITPTPKVTWCGEPLGAENYDVAYSNNVNAGTATVKITGKGEYALENTTYGGTFSDKLYEYEATATTNFTISPAAISSAKIAYTSANYNGTALKPAVSNVVAGKLAVPATGYTVSYSNNTNAGTATVTITGKGNFSGTKKYTFAINAISIANANVTGISDVECTGQAITQNNLAVTVNGKKLTADKDYTVAYANNKNAGTAKLTITGKGNYKGSIAKTFNIKRANISNAKLVLSKTAFTYNGKVQKPSVKTVGGKKLTAGVDYTLKCSNAKSKKAGKYTVQVIGKGNFTGTSAKAKYTIKKAPNTIKAKIRNFDIKSSGSNTVTVPAKKAFSIKGAKGKVTFQKVAGSSKISISKGGKITIRGNIAEGTYPIIFKVKAAGNANYKAKTVKVKAVYVRYRAY